jgi:hypothetical protein
MLLVLIKKTLLNIELLHLDGDKLIKINEKGELNFDFSYVGIAGIKDFELFFYNLENLLIMVMKIHQMCML